MPPGDAIVCRELTRSFDGFLALDSLDLEVPERSVFGFLGPNGAGKTTTIKILTGLINPTRGAATVAGVDAREHSVDSRRRLGYLPEEPSFYGWMTGREFLEFSGRLFDLGRDELRERVDSLLEEVGLDEDGGRRVRTYSRGMRQRLGMAQALVNDPEVVFLDEPCSALDPLGRIEILEMIERLGREATVFMSSHILSDVDRICDTVAVLDRGKLVVQAGIEELRQRYVLPIFRVEFDRKPSEFRVRLNEADWVEEVDEVDGRRFVVHASDLERAKNSLPRIAASDEANLVRYELSSPTLEDIFVRMVGG